MLKRLSIFIAVILMTAIGYDAFAVPAPPHPVRVELPDGTTITVKMTGDEFFMYTTTTDGYNVLRSEDGYYYYAQDAGGKLVSTGVRANDPGRRTAEERTILSRVLVGAPSWARAASQSSSLRTMAQQAEMEIPQDVKEMRKMATRSGEPYKSLVILVNFYDIKFNAANSRQAFDNMLNQTGYSTNGATGSAADYYKYNSNGQFNPQFDVVGPYTLSGSLNSYSMANGNPRNMISEAIALADPDVDFSQYADGSTGRPIYVFYAGIPSQQTSIWPHMSSIQSVTVDGVRLSQYACSSEFRASNYSLFTGIGLFCHEFGHAIGWPDFYDTDYGQNGQSPHVEQYSLMASGSYNNGECSPPSITAMERYMQGWLPEFTEFPNSGSYTLKPVSEDAGYLVKTNLNGEYFLLEVRNGTDANGSNIWDSKLAQELGISMPIMMVYHVDKSSNQVGTTTAKILWDNWFQTNKINAYAAHECFKVVRANENSISAWGYPGPSNVTTLSSRANGEFMPWDGDSMVEEFTSIAKSGNNIVVNLYNGIVVSQYLNAVRVGDNYAEFEWSTFPHTGTFTVELLDTQDAMLQQFETSEKAIAVTMLQPDTSYKLKVTANGGGESDEIGFKTQRDAGLTIFPYLPIKGSYTAGDNIVLRLAGIQEKIVSWEWTVDGTVVDATSITATSGKHTISVKIELENGNEEIFTKIINVP